MLVNAGTEPAVDLRLHGVESIGFGSVVDLESLTDPLGLLRDADLGSEVTVVQRTDRLIPSEDADISAAVA